LARAALTSGTCLTGEPGPRAAPGWQTLPASRPPPP
jgi:hypothetical protein